MTDDTATLVSRIAHLQEATRDDYEYIVNGVAHGPPGELTEGLNGEKYWPPEEIEKAAPSLEGKPVYASHGDGDREQIGAVLRSAFEDDVGVVYEAGLNDADIAGDLSIGQREVSIEATADEVDRHGRTGASILRDYEYTGLATPQEGASEGNYTAAGDASSNPGIAALSAGDIEASLSGDASLSTMMAELSSAKQTFADLLADRDPLVSTDELMERFTVAELREKVDALDVGRETPAPEPTIQTGGGSSSAALSSEDAERVDELEAQLEAIEDQDNILAEKQRELIKDELAELRGD